MIIFVEIAFLAISCAITKSVQIFPVPKSHINFFVKYYYWPITAAGEILSKKNLKIASLSFSTTFLFSCIFTFFFSPNRIHEQKNFAYL